MGGQGESQDEDRKQHVWLCYNKASACVVCSRSVDCSRHNDEDDCDGQAASGPESQVNHARNPSSTDNLHGEIDKKIVGS